MLRRASLALLLLLPLGCRQPTTTSGSAEAPAAAETRPLALWEVTKTGMPTSYLFGSCPLGVKLDTALPPEHMDKALNAALFVAEADTDLLGESHMEALMTLPEGTTVSSMLGPEDWESLAEASGFGPLIAMFDGMHPMVIGVMTTLSVLADVPGAHEDGEMDETLLAAVRAANVPTAFLETPQESLDRVVGLPMDRFLEPLRAIAAAGDLDARRDEMAAILSLCTQGDLERASAAMAATNDVLHSSAAMGRLNAQWADAIEGFLGQGPTFVSVTGGRVVGDDGVPALLAARGWTLTRLRGSIAPPEEASADEGMVLLADILEAAIPLVVEDHCRESGYVPLCFGVAGEQCGPMVEAVTRECIAEASLPEQVPEAEMLELLRGVGSCVGLKFQDRYGDAPLEDPACAAALE